MRHAFIAVLLLLASTALQAQVPGEPAASAPETAASAPPPPPPPSCSAVTARAMSADLQAATAQSQGKELDSVGQLLDEAIKLWSATLSSCEGRARERAERNLADNRKARASISERQAAGSQCELSHRDAASLQELARQAFGDRRWPDAASLYRKAETMWDLAAEHCTGSQQQVAAKRREQSEIDGHNAEFCAPLFDRSREFTQKFRNSAAGLAVPERQQQSQIAETLWRDTAKQCKGSALELATNNAQALARERGTPWVASAAPQAVIAAAPVAPAAKPAIGAPPTPTPTPVPVPPPIAVAARVPTPAAAPPVEALKELDVRSGDTRYKGQFVREDGQVVSGTGRVEWTNGDVYEGPLLRNERHGVGVFIWASGQRYQGDWDHDKATGRGELRFANGNQYKGTVVEGQPHGEGEMLYASGDLYKGQIQQGVPHGRGSYQWVNGQRYDGDWVRDQQQGQGVLRFANGNRYEGQIQGGLPHGKGRMSFVSGDVYEGLMDRGLATGQGVYVWKTGDRYEGAWAGGQKHGQGTFFWASGDKWEGEFKADERTDEGTLTRKEK